MLKHFFDVSLATALFDVHARIFVFAIISNAYFIKINADFY